MELLESISFDCLDFNFEDRVQVKVRAVTLL